MGNSKRDRWKKIFELIATVILVLISIWYRTVTLPDESENVNSDSQEATQAESNVEGVMELHMIECGQADSFLFVQGEDTCLIDCGKISTGDDVVEYIQNLGIKQLDYVIVTHPHEDHAGGAQEVITNFEVGTIIMPKAKAEHTTANYFANLMDTIIEGQYNFEYAVQDSKYKLGEASMEMVGVMPDYEGDANNSSIVMKVSFGEMDVLMTGDAEKAVERYILDMGKDIDCEILKMGHHGSDTSTTDEFLEAVDPDYALISCKLGNKHEHPVKSVMQKLEARNIPVYRTDESGTVVATITSTDVTFSCEPGDYLSGIELEMREAS